MNSRDVSTPSVLAAEDAAIGSRILQKKNHILYDFIIGRTDPEASMASKTLSVTIPEQLYRRIDEQRAKGHYSRSEFVREALRRFVGFPAVEATSEEEAAIKKGRAEIARGDYVSLDDLDR